MSTLITPLMVSLTKKQKDVVELVESGVVEALNLALPLVKTIPLVGGTVGASIEVVLHIIQVTDVRLLPCSNWVF